MPVASPPAQALLLRLRFFFHLLRFAAKAKPSRVRVTHFDERGTRRRVRVPFELADTFERKNYGEWVRVDELLLRWNILLEYREDGGRYVSRVRERTPAPYLGRPLDPRLQMQLSCVLLERQGGTAPLLTDLIDPELERLSQPLSRP